MKKLSMLAVFLFAVTISSSAPAANWVHVYSDEYTDYYVDKDSIKRGIHSEQYQFSKSEGFSAYVVTGYEFIAALIAVAVLSVAVTTFAESKVCSRCGGSGKIRYSVSVPNYNYHHDKKGRRVRYPPYFRTEGKLKLCPICHGTGRIRVS